ncbi:MAG: helix-turn-helix domain-containing protein [Pricia sp.]
MEYNFYAFFETVGFIQALTLGALLTAVHKSKYKSTLFLGFFLLAFALETVPIILESLGAFDLYPSLYLLPFDFFWLHFPLFYIYTQQISIFSDDKIKYWVLYPGILAFIAQLIFFFFSYEIKFAIADSVGYDIYTYCKIAYGLVIGVYTLFILNRHRIEVHNYFSMVESKELKWARNFLIFNIIGSLLYSIFNHTIGKSIFAEIFFVCFDLILIYWVSYHGVKQRNVISLLVKKEEFESASIEPLEKILAGRVDESNDESDKKEDKEALMEKIDAYMVSSESFTHKDLTIIDLSERLEVHPKRISTTINTVQNQNFNAYVNQFRVKKAEELLQDESKGHLSIEGIGNEVGFHSKSAFYSAFKKFSGTTPSKYKEGIMF